MGQPDPAASNSASLAAALAALGYPGFRQLRGETAQRPENVLLAAITSNNLEVRIIEGLPWLVVTYSDLDWEHLITRAKASDTQNRLGFLVTLAREVAELRGESAIAAKLKEVVDLLDRARLPYEDTLCQSSLSTAERRWLEQNRPPEAVHWHLLTDLTAETLHYVT